MSSSLRDNRCPEPLAYSVSDAIKVSGIGRTTLYSLMATGRIKYVKVGQRTLIKRVDLVSLLADDIPSRPEPSQA